MMKVSVIVTVYKNTIALKLILDALRRQTYKEFEVVVAEDDQDDAMKVLLAQYDDLNILHVSHEDKGMRKNIIQNKALAKANGEYLIFIDGDCIPYSTFIEGHVILAEEKTVLSGRRVNLDEVVSNDLRNNKYTSIYLEQNYWRFFRLMRDKTVKYEQGIYLNPKGVIYNKFIKNSKRNVSILGCNFSCFKSDFMAINGFDESYAGTALGDDTDLDWRFRAYGCSLKSCKNVANVFHLYHEVFDRGEATDRLVLMKQREKDNLFICQKGVDQYLAS
ncbi:MAG: glycosyltransferase [Epsilonproteobacteria bacterium]|nr:glycosyltransferase [Campylobacterota bacterium]